LGIVLNEFGYKLSLERDMDALADAYVVHAAEVYRVVRAIVGNEASAEDVTHEAFIKAHRNLHRYDRDRPIRPWLITIAVRLALDNVRRERIRHLITHAARPRDYGRLQIESIDTRIDTDAALRMLAPRERAVVVARHYVGMSYQEIAEMLATSPGNVGTLLHRAHARLRRVLASDESSTPQDELPVDRGDSEVINDD
jgi:RNA polymerase sigma-70 factor (ECF subfamily)